MNVCRESRSALPQSSYAKYHNTHWLRLHCHRPPPSREDCEKCAASPGLMIMITNMPQVPKSETFWHGALRNSLAKYSLPPYPPDLLLHSTTGTPQSQSWRIFPYNSFICPSIHFENVNSCASSLFDYSCFISCIYVFSPSPLWTFLSLSPVWGWLFASDFSLWQWDSFSFSCFAFVFWKIAW